MTGNFRFDPMSEEDGRRYRIEIDGESFYVVLTPTSITAAYAYENREENIKQRLLLEKFCSALTKAMGGE